MLLETLIGVGYQFLVNLPTDFLSFIFIFLNDNNPGTQFILEFPQEIFCVVLFQKAKKKIMAIPDESDEIDYYGCVSYLNMATQ